MYYRILKDFQNNFGRFLKTNFCNPTIPQIFSQIGRFNVGLSDGRYLN